MKDKAEGFIYAVNEAGLPRDMCRVGGGAANITGLTPAEVAKRFWTLRGLKLRYAFEIGGVVQREEWDLEVGSAPKERIYRYPEIDEERDRGEWVSRIEWDLSDVQKVGEGDYGVEVFIADHDRRLRHLFQLGGRVPRGFRVLDVTMVEICGKMVEIGLYTKAEGTTGRILDVEVVEDFWGFS